MSKAQELLEALDALEQGEDTSEGVALNKAAVRKAMDHHKIKGKVSGSGKSMTVELESDADKKKFHKHIGKWDGSGNQAGGWRLKASGHTDRGDFNDKSSAHHY